MIVSRDHYFKKIWQASLTILLTLIPGVLAFADSSSNGGGVGITLQSFTIPSTDLSVMFLSQIFGSVGSQLPMGGATIFGQIFYVFNWGILMVAGVMLSYTTGRSIVEIANAESGQMGRKFSWWVPARVVLGVSLLVPQATGYSTLNSVVMWVTLQGVGLADAVWTQVVTYLKQGGVLYSAPLSMNNSSSTNNTIDTTLLDGGSSNDPNGVGVASVLRSQICMQALYKHLVTSISQDDPPVPTLTEQCTPSDCPSPSPSGPGTGVDPSVVSCIKFPCNLGKYVTSLCKGVGCTASSYAKGLEVLNGSNNNLDGICGGYTWFPVKSDPNNGSGPSEYAQNKSTGLQSVVAAFASVANDVVNTYTNNEIDLFNNSTTPFSDSNVPGDIVNFSTGTATTLMEEVGVYQSAIATMRIYAGNGYGNQSVATGPKSCPLVSTCQLVVGGSNNGCTWAPDPNCSATGDVTQDMIAKGWIAAGSYYFSLMSFSPSTSNMDISNYHFYTINANVPAYCYATPNGPKLTTCNVAQLAIGSVLTKDEVGSLERRLAWVGDNTHGLVSQANTAINSLNKGQGITPGGANLPQDLQNFVGQQQLSIGTGAYTLSGILLSSLSSAGNNIFCTWGYNMGITPATLPSSCNQPGKYNVGPSASPILQLQMLGYQMLDSCVGFWQNFFQKLLTALSIAYAAEMAASITGTIVGAFTFWGTTTGATMGILNGILTIIQQSVSMFVITPVLVGLPIASAATLLMITTGVTLAYYIPMLPFMLFIFGAIGWLAYVIEAMVAAPLVALGMTHPEGHDLLGKAEQSLMMLLAIFVRPAAMIIGLIAGMVVSYVALSVLNTGFGQVIYSLYYDSSNGKFVETGAGQQIRDSAMILVYVFISMSIVQQCFSLIHIIPAKIMHWIGLTQEHGMEAQMAESVKAGVTGAGEKMGGAYGQAAGAAKFNLPSSLGSDSKPQGGGDDSGGMKGSDASATGGGDASTAAPAATEAVAL